MKSKKQPGVVGTVFGWIWRAIQFPFQTVAVVMALALLMSWCVLVYLPGTARSNGRDVFFLSLRCMDLETSRALNPLYLIQPYNHLAKLVTDLRKPPIRSVPPELFRQSNALAARIWNLNDPTERQAVHAWGEGLMRMVIHYHEVNGEYPQSL